MPGESRGFSQVEAGSQIFLELRQGTQGASRVAPGSPVSIPVVRGSSGLLSSHCRGIRLQFALKWESRGPSRVGAGNFGFPPVATVTSGSFSWCQWKSGILSGCEGPLGIPLGSLQWKRVSFSVEAGTSVFLSCSDVDLGVCLQFQTGNQVLTCV